LLRTCRSQDAQQPTSAVKDAKQRDMAELAGILGQGQGQGGWQQLSRQEQDELARWAPGTWVVQASTAGSMRGAQVSGLACALCCTCNRCCSGAPLHCHPDLVSATLCCCRCYSGFGLDIHKLMEAGQAAAGGRRSGRARKQDSAGQAAEDGAVVLFFS
jgi:hypothetical protein